MEANGTSHATIEKRSQPPKIEQFKVYNRRWVILATLAILNISNALQWLAFAPVAYITADFYNIELAIVNLLSVVYMITGIPCGIIATWLLDTFGLRASIVLSAWLNFLGSIFRIVSAVDGISEDARVPLVFVGTTLAALAQPFMLFAPTKLAALWFPENQRATANMVATMSNPLGIMLANILSPILAPTADKMLFMLGIESIPGIFAVVMATFGVCSNNPPTPPSASAETPSESFVVGVKALFKNGPYWLLAWAVGGGIALFSVLTTLLSQMLCPWGYDASFAGVVCASAMIGAGLVGAAIAGIIVDKTKRYLEITKICYTIACLSLVAFAVMHNREGLWVPIAISCGVFGLFGLPVYPIGNELSVETTYPVGEATSSGILFMFGQLQGIVLVVVLSAIGREMSPDELGNSKCTTNDDSEVKVYDMALSTYIMTGYAAIVLIFFVAAFRTKYKRLEAERNQLDNMHSNDCKTTDPNLSYENYVDLYEEGVFTPEKGEITVF
ncbi:solute carrier family 49 member A3-like [Styela clava]